MLGEAWCSWLRPCRNVADSIPHEVTGYFIDLILAASLWPWGRPSLQQKCYQAYVLGSQPCQPHVPIA
jgi:hypothetical protein